MSNYFDHLFDPAANTMTDLVNAFRLQTEKDAVAILSSQVVSGA